MAHALLQTQKHFCRIADLKCQGVPWWGCCCFCGLWRGLFLQLCSSAVLHRPTQKPTLAVPDYHKDDDDDDDGNVYSSNNSFNAE